MVQSNPTTPPTAPLDDEQVDLLLRFVHERDIACPRCGYNLRNLTTPVCPECREQLSLKVGVPRVPLLPLLMTIVPGAFCAVAVGIFSVMCVLHGPPSLSRDWGVWMLIGFFLLSAIAGVALAFANRWFLRLHRSVQTGLAAIVWAVHLGVFILVVSSV